MGGKALRSIELGPTGRDALKHLFGVVRTSERRHEKEIRRTPPFTLSAVVNGFAAMPLLGVVLKVVTSTGRTLDKLFHRFLFTPIISIIALEPAVTDHTMAAL